MGVTFHRRCEFLDENRYVRKAYVRFPIKCSQYVSLKTVGQVNVGVFLLRELHSKVAHPVNFPRGINSGLMYCPSRCTRHARDIACMMKVSINRPFCTIG